MTATLEDMAKNRAEDRALQQAVVELVRLAQERGLALTGPDGLLKQLTKREAGSDRANLCHSPPLRRPIPGCRNILMETAGNTVGETVPAKTLPDLRRSVKWVMSYYGVGDGWCFSCGGFAGHVKLIFTNGAALEPVPPVGMGKATRGVELDSVDDLDARQIAAWMNKSRPCRVPVARSVESGRNHHRLPIGKRTLAGGRCPSSRHADPLGERPRRRRFRSGRGT